MKIFVARKSCGCKAAAEFGEEESAIFIKDCEDAGWIVTHEECPVEGLTSFRCAAHENVTKGGQG